ncbi:hypothetical protein BVX98_04330 [bacterium F11]|nr:hypothetical protein BVX98_04330 [bacterium F11]
MLPLLKGSAQSHPDPWLGNIIGKNVFRLDFPRSISRKVSLQKKHLKRLSRPSFFYVKIHSNETSLLKTLTTMGFYVVDVGLTFQRIGSVVKGTSKGSMVIRQTSEKDRADVLRIAKTSFRYSRFHSDPLISKEIANKIKMKWVDNFYSGKRGNALFVAEKKGRILGFLLSLKKGKGRKEVNIIDLIATTNKAKGKGVGLSLIYGFMKSFKSKKALFQVGTQAVNIPSVRLYEKCGFRLIGTQYVLHGHF